MKDKSLTLLRLNACLNKLIELPDDKFHFSRWVSEYNLETTCGTVCCIAGWHPLWFPEAGLKWSTIKIYKGNFSYTEAISLTVDLPPHYIDPIAIALSRFYGITRDVVYVLFYNDAQRDFYTPLPTLGEKSTKQEVIMVWQEVIHVIESIKGDPLGILLDKDKVISVNY